jgi:hypothetical protein
MGPMIASDKHLTLAHLCLTQQYIDGPTWAGLCRTGIFQPWLYVLYKSKVTAVCEKSTTTMTTKKSWMKLMKELEFQVPMKTWVIWRLTSGMFQYVFSIYAVLD